MEDCYQKAKLMQQEIDLKTKIKEKLWDEACDKDNALQKEIEKLEDELYEYQADNYMFGGEDI